MELTAEGKTVSYSLIVCLIITYLACIARFILRARQKWHLSLSDYCIAASLLFFTAYAGCAFGMVYNRIGSINLSILPLDVIQQVYKRTFATEILMGPCVTLAKLSLLLLWRDIFVSQVFQRMNYAVIAITIAWLIGVTICLFLQCTPISGAWDAIVLAEGGTCRPYGQILYGYELSNIFIDILIIILPVTQVKDLQMRSTRKSTVILVFVLGGLVIVASVVRIYYQNRTEGQAVGQNVSANFTMTYLWTNIQLAATIICACLPILLPIFLRWLARFPNFVSTFVGSGRSKNRITEQNSAGMYIDLGDSHSRRRDLQGK